MSVDAESLAMAKEALRASDTGRSVTYLGVPIEALDRDDLLLLVAWAMDELDRERDSHTRSIGMIEAQARNKVSA